MYYANSFLNQLLPNKAKKVRYAPLQSATEFALLRILVFIDRHLIHT